VNNLGFGCAALTSLNDRKASLSLLEFAFENGIRHFDVARLYGMGSAENIVGEFAKTKREQVTITTKLGLNPPQYMPASEGITGKIKKLVKRFPGMQGLVKRALHHSVRPDFSVANAVKSLDKSLKELNTGYVDYLLLHEATVADANNGELILFLQDQQQKGKVLKYGVGTSYAKMGNDCSLFPAGFSVFQFDSDPLQENILHLKNPRSGLVITHSVFRNLSKLEEKFEIADKNKLRDLQDNVPVDILNKDNLAPLVLFYCSLKNTDGITLFSSTKKEKIAGNIKAVNKLASSGSAPAVEELMNIIRKTGAAGKEK
jgi:D-threo-aldose 1-dehydrogenase